MRQKGMQRSNQCKRRVIGAKMDQIAPQIAKDYQIQKNPSLPIKAVRGCLYLSKSRKSETPIFYNVSYPKVQCISECRRSETPHNFERDHYVGSMYIRM